MGTNHTLGFRTCVTNNLKLQHTSQDQCINDAAGSSLTAAGVTSLPFAHTARGAFAAARWATRAAAYNGNRKQSANITLNLKSSSRSHGHANFIS